MWRAALILIVSSVVAGLPAQAAEQAHIKHLRVGRHADYDRLVLELDRAVEVVWGASEDPQAPVFEIAATPLHPQVLETGLARMGTVNVESTPAGARLRTDSRPRRVRVFRLSKPPRIVIDFADDKPEPFTAPGGTDAIAPQAEPMLRGLPPVPTPTAQARPAPKTAPSKQAKTASKTAPRRQSKAVPKTETPAGEASATADASATQPTPEGAPQGARSPFAPPTRDLIERSLKSRPAPGPESAAAPKAREPASAPAPAPARPSERAAASKPVTPTPSPRHATEAPRRPKTARVPHAAGRDLTGLWIGLGALVLVALVVGVGIVLRRPPAQARYDHEGDEALEGFSPETITSEELYRDGTRVEILDKRLDEEVRARMQLEERLLHANEEIKVLRDRLGRLERRRGA